ncbi:hypothetical protein Rcae01_05008 [Novipirellula caenicola]|uniref:Uncharacterized protein n=1 Tax=Novipirellula caenicola TaxID=1536901 RepID=A0ABP9VWI9_9BACT
MSFQGVACETRPLTRHGSGRNESLDDFRYRIHPPGEAGRVGKRAFSEFSGEGFVAAGLNVVS